MKKLFLVALLVLFVAPVEAKIVNLVWDASPSVGVTGYKIYYDCANSEAPFDGTEATLPSPIDVGSVTAYAVLGLPDNLGCYFTATAVDVVGFESVFSNIVYSPAFAPPEPPLTLGGTTQVNNVNVPIQ